MMESEEETEETIRNIISLVNKINSPSEISLCREKLLRYEIYLKDVVFKAIRSSEKTELEDDFIGKSYLPSEFSECYTPRTTSNGNCLFSSLSLLLVHSEKLSCILRYLSVIEIVLNISYYASHSFFNVAKTLNLNENNLFAKTLSDKCSCQFSGSNREYCLLEESKNASRDFTWSPMIILISLASLVNRKIRSIYPNTNGYFDSIFNSTISPRTVCMSGDTLHILWCNTNPKVEGPEFKPNHFVPVFFKQLTSPPDKQMKLEGKKKIQKNVKKIHNRRIDSMLKKIDSSNPCTDPPADSSLVEPSPDKPSTSIINEPSPTKPSTSVVRDFTNLGKNNANFERFDIGVLLPNLKSLSTQEKYDLMKNVWTPPDDYEFPSTIFSAKRKGSCQITYLKKYNSSNQFQHLVYSPLKDALFCLPCLLFRHENVGKDEKLFSDGLKYWPSITKKLESHFSPSNSNTIKHHELSVSYMDAFLENYRNPSNQIDNLVISKPERENIARNREILGLVFELVLYLGRQGIPFRGHRDDLKHLYDTNNNPGNFAELLKTYARTGNEIAIRILEKMPRNATYRSKEIQNQCIDTIGKVIVRKISEKVKKSRWFSILADEASDSSCTEQMALVVRFLNSDKKIEERFVSFLSCDYGQSGEGLSKLILENVDKLDIDMKNCRGQGYDGAGAMAGGIKGVAKRISDIYPKAPYCHCCSHRLNLCVCRVAKTKIVRRTFDTCRVISDLLTDHSKEKRLYEATTLELYPNDKTKQKKLIDFCRTRWCERLDGIKRFVTCYFIVHETLKKIKKNVYFDYSFWTPDVQTKARGLYAHIRKFKFIVSLVISKNILSYFSGITKGLQAVASSIVSAHEWIENLLRTLQKIRSEVSTYHQQWYKEALELAEKIEIEPTLKRIQLGKYADEETEEDPIAVYYKREVTIPLLDELVVELKTRFSKDSLVYADSFYVMPSMIKKSITSGENWKEKLISFMKLHQEDMYDIDDVPAELELWENKWKNVSASTIADDFSYVQDLLRCVEPSIYPNIYRLLELLSVYPPTSCSCERAISVIRRLKTPLRSTMTQKRFNNLSLMMIHRDIDLDLEELINQLARDYPKRLRMLYVLSDD